MLTGLIVLNLFSIWLYILPLLCLGVVGGLLLSIVLVRTIWVRYDYCASSCPAKIGRFVGRALVACLYGTIGLYANACATNCAYLVLNLPIDLLLARYGVRPATTAIDLSISC